MTYKTIIGIIIFITIMSITIMSYAIYYGITENDKLEKEYNICLKQNISCIKEYCDAKYYDTTHGLLFRKYQLCKDIGGNNGIQYNIRTMQENQ